MTPPVLAEGHGNINYVGLPSFILAETQFYLKKKKKVPQTQNTPTNPKRERKKEEMKHTNQRPTNLSFFGLSALKKKVCVPIPAFLTG